MKIILVLIIIPDSLVAKPQRIERTICRTQPGAQLTDTWSPLVAAAVNCYGIFGCGIVPKIL